METQNQIVKQLDTHKVKKLYRSSAKAQKVLDVLSKRSKSQKVTTVPLVERKTGFPVHDIITVFKRLDEAGAGRFYYGRNSYPSRFEWSRNMLSIARLAAEAKSEEKTVVVARRHEVPKVVGVADPQSEPVSVDVSAVDVVAAVTAAEEVPVVTVPVNDDAPAVSSPGVRVIEHVFALRPDFVVSLKLPVDVSAVEIVRFTDYLATIPFVD